ncbi:uncharacterized protein BO88DRAFT_60837 [Aspergillus vadensis CBS 113365]|uniref:Uncharacterized protein n=1 Tax=Aspergillus vadensis (strain CBS 113365 / IMI 142717 / IBT 24658) TaxID=1448311 RepID=A0A319B9S8_ASPVC|nr:hypothetical protein BO88DRAFT_60837 [Aspergillus vadensis CBS 113365]PYH68604.1 hypothetical protein BO88DRAFT_60837 [Aspergillus vadensis CBS 113365]
MRWPRPESQEARKSRREILCTGSCLSYRPPSRVVLHCLQPSSGQQLIIVRGVYLGTYTLEIHFWDVIYLSYSDHWARGVSQGMCWLLLAAWDCSALFRPLFASCFAALLLFRHCLGYMGVMEAITTLFYFFVTFASLDSSMCSLCRGGSVDEREITLEKRRVEFASLLLTSREIALHVPASTMELHRSFI